MAVSGARSLEGTKLDSILGHCLVRASLRKVKGDGRLAASYAVIRATPKASRVAAFIALWGTALVQLERDALGVEEYVEWAAESRATVYRRLAEFRELWPEFDTPNELACRVAAEMRRRGDRVGSPSIVVPA